MQEICTDLAKEYDKLDAIVAAPGASGWNLMKPAGGWTLKDQIRQPACYNERVKPAVTAFRRL
jgi:hypothetical protein